MEERIERDTEQATPRDRKIEQKVRAFYNDFGWVSRHNQSGEDILFRQFRPQYHQYHRNVIDRTISCFSGLSGKLLIAGCGDLPESHAILANRFSECTCIDISRRALDITKSKLGGNAAYICGSILQIPTPDNTFDAVLCAHVIYHIDIELQETAVNELIRVVRPGGRIVIIYSNPASFPERLARARNLLRRLAGRGQANHGSASTGSVPAERPDLYFARHPNGWWRRFERQCEVSLRPWDVMGNHQEKALVRSDAMAAVVYRACSWIEARFPETAAHWWQYPIVVLAKKITGSDEAQPQYPQPQYR